ncbi:hypothetical protein JI58_08325 [Marinosulfonomonas sp. PRT-SC04]|nr:hypothetical protein JI58_08325 [Marinosulfonomonas sp. PRT-SC04]
MTQADFARHMGVSRAAVSQWKSRDILLDDAFTQPGKKGKLVVVIAVEQVRRNRDIGQALGNGIETRTSTEAAGYADALAVSDPVDAQPDLLSVEPAEVSVEQPADAPTQPKKNTVEDQLKRAKLEEQLRRNRMQASDEALRQGMLMAVDDVREQMSRISLMMMQIFEGALPDLAASVAAQFDVPQRDVLHLLRAEFKKVRATAAMKEKARAASVSQDEMVSVELE